MECRGFATTAAATVLLRCHTGGGVVFRGGGCFGGETSLTFINAQPKWQGPPRASKIDDWPPADRHGPLAPPPVYYYSDGLTTSRVRPPLCVRYTDQFDSVRIIIGYPAPALLATGSEPPPSRSAIVLIVVAVKSEKRKKVEKKKHPVRTFEIDPL